MVTTLVDFMKQLDLQCEFILKVELKKENETHSKGTLFCHFHHATVDCYTIERKLCMNKKVILPQGRLHVQMVEGNQCHPMSVYKCTPHTDQAWQPYPKCKLLLPSQLLGKYLQEVLIVTRASVRR